MNKKSVKLIGIAVGFLLLAGVGLVVKKKLKQTRLTVDTGSGSGDGAGSGSGDGAGDGAGSSFNAKTRAKLLHDSMKGIGTNESKFKEAVSGLNLDQRIKVKKSFNANYSEGTDLCGWIEGEFSGAAEDKNLALFNYPTGAWISNCG